MYANLMGKKPSNGVRKLPACRKRIVPPSYFPPEMPIQYFLFYYADAYIKQDLSSQYLLCTVEK